MCVSSEDIQVIFSLQINERGFPGNDRAVCLLLFGLERSDEKQQYPLQTSLCIFNLIREALCFNGEKQ